MQAQAGDNTDAEQALPLRVQVMMAAKSGTWPLLHLVSIGCHVAVSELLQRLAATFRPAAPGGAAGDEASKPRAKGSPVWGAAASHAAAPCEGDSVFAIKVRALLESGALSRLQHASSDALDASQCIKAHLSRSLSRSLTTSRSRVRSFQDAARLVSSTSQLTQRPKRPVAAKASSHEVAACCAAAQHEYPVLAIAATANTMMHMVDVRRSALSCSCNIAVHHNFGTTSAGCVQCCWDKAASAH